MRLFAGGLIALLWKYSFVLPSCAQQEAVLEEAYIRQETPAVEIPHYQGKRHILHPLSASFPSLSDPIIRTARAVQLRI